MGPMGPCGSLGPIIFAGLAYFSQDLRVFDKSAATPATTHPSIKESTKGGGRRRRPPPFVEAARSAASSMDGCGEAGEAQGILDGSNFVATSLQLRSDFVATSSDLACKGQKRLLRDATQLIWSKVGQGRKLVKKSKKVESSQNGLAYSGKS